MFARIQTWVKKAMGVKDVVTDLSAKSKDLLDHTKAAYEDVTKDGLGMDDFGKVGSHFTELKNETVEIVQQAKEKIKKVKTKSEAPVASSSTASKKTSKSA